MRPLYTIDNRYTSITTNAWEKEPEMLLNSSKGEEPNLVASEPEVIQTP
jgi:hypothetical protein